MDFSNISVLCVGDLMLDRYVYSDMERISPEAPVPVLLMRHTREMLGGAGNVASNVASLGGRAVLIGMLGRDASGDCLRRILAHLPGVVAGCIDTNDRPTICKTRFIAANQQVVRADEESLQPLTAAEEAALLEAVRSWIGRVGAVVLSDYGKGMLNAATIAAVTGAARAAGVPVFVDPKSPDFSQYRGATCITPNLKELAAASGEAVGDEAGVVRAARRVLAQAGAGAILATRSEKGMVLVEAGGEVHSVPARAREVFDVSGAGDTVIATMALCHAAGRPLSQAMYVANAAASVVVSKLGTATATMAEVMRELDAQEYEPGTAATSGVQKLERVRDLVGHWKEQGLVVGFTNGCFDVLHPGHVALLARARGECDRLVVALNTDASVRRLKGPTRPVNTLDARAEVMAAVRYVDCVVAFDGDTPLELIRELLPNVLVKGADYTVDRVVGADLVQAAGGRVVLADLVSGQSTTATITRMQTTEPVA
jgi:D-beta-D-heptose 7-phosphate kinase/D-beta-D-heptose 1-phosphate adenosyltransferase